MKNFYSMSACLLLLSGIALAQAAKPEPQTVSQVLAHSVTNVEHEFVPAAEAMPEDKYAFAPTTGEFKGVRTFGQQVKHVAAVNYISGQRHPGREVPGRHRRRERPGLDQEQGRHHQILEGFVRIPS